MTLGRWWEALQDRVTAFLAPDEDFPSGKSILCVRRGWGIRMEAPPPWPSSLPPLPVQPGKELVSRTLKNPSSVP